MAESIFDVAPENPQKPHIADDMEKAAVQEHAGEERQESFEWRVTMSFERQLNVRGGKGVGLNERLARRWGKGNLVNENEHVRSDQQQRHNRESSAWVQVLQWNHGFTLRDPIAA